MLRYLRYQLAYVNSSISKSWLLQQQLRSTNLYARFSPQIIQSHMDSCTSRKAAEPTSPAVKFLWIFQPTDQTSSPTIFQHLVHFLGVFKKYQLVPLPTLYFIFFFLSYLSSFIFSLILSGESLSTIIISQTGAKYTPYALHVELFLTQLTHLRSETEVNRVNRVRIEQIELKSNNNYYF